MTLEERLLTKSMIPMSSILLSLLACTSPAPPPPEPEATTTTSAPVSPESELADVKERLEAARTRLFDEGKYNCCVKPSCDWCALHEGSCACFTNLQAGEAVCPGCGLGWHNGQGIVEGVDAKDVKWNITHEHPAGGHQH